ncbi:histidine kinase [Duganella sp. CY15W]|uniref:sensor histidine kinase n=1 Tax=Duganella sp. CY15W TaxID=2692172 RepID=UPI00136BA5C3|nr:sensor histidine kinase [Duganella sp. CY15W]MYM31661.1 histidine kinase [Duganella sp. CY15W]
MAVPMLFRGYAALLLLVGVLLAPCRAVADADMSLPLQGANAAWLRDPSGQLVVADVVARAAAFQAMQDGSLSKGYTRDVYWLRLILPADLEGRHWLEVPPAVLDDVRVYLPRHGGGWEERRSGDRLPFSSHEAPYRSAAFHLDAAHAGQILYLRIQTTSMMAAVPRLWHDHALRAEADAELLGFGLYLGLMITVALFNLVGWFMMRRPLYGVFSLFVICDVLRWMALDGTANQFFFPHHPAIVATLVTPLLGALGITGALCQISLLQLDRQQPFLLRYYYVVIVLGVLIMLTPLIGNVGLLSTVFFYMLLFAPLLMLRAYLRLWRSGSLASRLVAVAMPVHFLLMLPSNLSVLALLPYDPATMRLAHFTDVPLVLLLHASIMLRGREAKRERNAALAASQREREAREEQGQFLAMITHEVRTPIAVIDAAAYSLRLLDQAGADASPRTARYANIDLAVRRMKTLMELAETHGRLAPGETAVEAAPLDLAQLTRETLAALEPAASARVALSVAPDDTLPPLRGDARLLYFALLNLLDNSLKYARPDSRIDVAIAPRTRGVVWQIRDFGCGVPPAMAEAIFEKYHRLDETADQPGLGLGLPLARQITERHGGHLRLDQGWRAGASFELWLPEAA